MIRAAVLIGLIIVVVGGAIFWWDIGTRAPSPSDTSNKIFVIQKGSGIREIGKNLKDAGLIRDPVIFFLYIKKENADTAIQAGDYKLSPSMSLKTVVDNLKHGTLDIWATFPEGMRAEEYAQILKKVLPTYDDSWRAAFNLNEGYLFPDTYLIPRDADQDTVISLMRNTFFNKVGELGLNEDSPELNKVLVLASLIEREAITDEEKPVIAGILYNRLELGMPLQVDATVQYAKGYDAIQEKWWPQVTVNDYQGVNSSYNTYRNPGLPPGPISNPGISAIQAALNPSNTPYLYYIHDLNGKIHYARTVEQHNANVNKYLR